MGKRRYNNTIRSDKPLRQAAILRSADSRRLDSAAGLGVRHEATAAARSGTSMGAAGVGCVGRRDDRLPDGLFDDRGNRRVFQVTQSHIMQPPAWRISSARCPIAKLCSTPMPGRAEIVAPDKLTAPPRASQLWPFQLTTAARPRRSATTTAARCSREIVRRIARRSITAWKTPVQERIARNDGQPSAPVALDAGIADRVQENQCDRRIGRGERDVHVTSAHTPTLRCIAALISYSIRRNFAADSGEDWCSAAGGEFGRQGVFSHG